MAWELVVLGEEHQVRLVFADHRLVGRDHHDFQAVNLLEFERFGIRRSGHAGKLRIQSEIILERDGRDGLIFFSRTFTPSLASTAWCRPFGPAPPLHGAAGELIDDDDLTSWRTMYSTSRLYNTRRARAAPRSSDA